MKEQDDIDSQSESSASDILDQKNEEGWEDIEPDTEDVSFVSLFDDRSFSTAKEMLIYCKGHHDFDIWRVRHDLDLQFLDLVKLVNYIRSEVKQGNKRPDVSSGSKFEDERYLKPELEDDALLYSLDDVFEDDENLPNGTAASEVDSLREQLATLQGQFSAYREEVQRSLLKRVENDPATEVSNSKAGQNSAASTTTSSGQSRNLEEGYFESYSYNSIHEIMLKDKIRTDAYRDFIYDNKHLFKDKIVLDVGCGTGILSMFCAKAGAKMVIAVDNSAIIEKTRENVFKNGLQDSIKCLRGKIEEVTMPVPQVDVIVSEWMGYCLLYESMLDSVIHARDKYLSPDGLMVPSHATIRLAPLADSDLKASHIDFWNDVYGFDMTPMLEKAHEEALIRITDKDELAAEGTTVLELDLHRATVADLSFSKPFSLTWKAGFRLLEGFVLWFDMFFAKSNKPEEVAGRLTIEKAKHASIDSFSTGPAYESTHWQQGVLLIKTPKDELAAGDELKGQLTYRKMSGQERSLDIDVRWSRQGEAQSSQTWVLD